MPTPDLQDLYFFAKVAEAGGFSAAARRLGLQTSLLSRRVALLEADLGVRLLNRSTRRLSLTDIGRRVLSHASAAVAEASAAAEAVAQMRAEPQGRVRLSCPVGLLDGTVDAILTRFVARHPQVLLSVDATNRRVDVIDEGLDLALRVREPPLEDSGLVIRPLSTTRQILVASPALLAREGLPQDLAALARLPTLGDLRAGDRHQWLFTGPGGRSVSFDHWPRLAVDHFPTLRRAALEGMGVACLPEMAVRDALHDGSLVRVLPDYSLPLGVMHVAFASRRGMVPAVRALLDALVEGLASGPAPA
jgi:DNA-binding transcriptional LysR family regulator